MGLRLKKQKKVKTSVCNLSIDFLHQQKLLYFEQNKGKPGVDIEMNNYFLDTCDLLEEYYEKKNSVKIINPYANDFQINERDLELERRYYEICKIDYKFNLKKDDFVCCDTAMDINAESFYVCFNCGKIGQIYTSSNSFKQSHDVYIPNKIVYKRINYFNVWLKQIQASEVSDAPAILIMRIKDELAKRRIHDLTNLKYHIIKKILKELNESKHYENINLIISKLTNIPPLIIPVDISEKMNLMFSSIQEPYEKYKGTRTNFFSYSYILYKFCELLDLPEYLKCLQLFKNREKIFHHDKLWKKIIIDMNEKEPSGFWRFIPTV